MRIQGTRFEAPHSNAGIRILFIFWHWPLCDAPRRANKFGRSPRSAQQGQQQSNFFLLLWWPKWGDIWYFDIPLLT
jgi:hypothetical protein